MFKILSLSNQSLSFQFEKSSIPAQQKSNFRKVAIITAVVLELLLVVGATSFGIAAIVTNAPMLWVGVIPCAIGMIGVIGGLFCVLKPPGKRNNWTFKRLSHAPYPRTEIYGDPIRGKYDKVIPSWR